MDVDIKFISISLYWEFVWCDLFMHISCFVPLMGWTSTPDSPVATLITKPFPARYRFSGRCFGRCDIRVLLFCNKVHISVWITCVQNQIQIKLTQLFISEHICKRRAKTKLYLSVVVVKGQYCKGFAQWTSNKRYWASQSSCNRKTSQLYALFLGKSIIHMFIFTSRFADLPPVWPNKLLTPRTRFSANLSGLCIEPWEENTCCKRLFIVFHENVAGTKKWCVIPICTVFQGMKS